MKQSPLTFHDLTFLGIHIEVEPGYPDSAADFDFDGALLHWGLRHGKRSDGESSWWVGLDFAMRSDETKPCPYEIAIKALGMFSVSDTVPEESREKLVFENGAALVYGAIREMVSNITSRSAHGQLMLPTATFVGTFEEHQRKAESKRLESATKESENP